MNNNPLVGVLISVYKADNTNYLKLALDSILNQTYKNIHFLIGVDGNVGEEITNILYEFKKRNNVSIFWYKENRGLACVLNDNIAEGEKLGCEFYARMDADDIALPDRFEKQLNFLIKNIDVDVVGGAIEEIDENSQLRGKRVEYPLTHNECRRFFRYRDPMAHPATFFRKSYFEKCGGYRNEYRKNQDTMLWFDGFMNGCRFANLSDTVLHFRVNDDFFRNRRNGLDRAKKMLKDRFIMNKALNYDISANIFACCMFFMTISPSWLKKILYKIR